MIDDSIWVVKIRNIKEDLKEKGFTDTLWLKWIKIFGAGSTLWGSNYGQITFWDNLKLQGYAYYDAELLKCWIDFVDSVRSYVLKVWIHNNGKEDWEFDVPVKVEIYETNTSDYKLVYSEIKKVKLHSDDSLIVEFAPWNPKERENYVLIFKTGSKIKDEFDEEIIAQYDECEENDSLSIFFAGIKENVNNKVSKVKICLRSNYEMFLYFDEAPTRLRIYDITGRLKFYGENKKIYTLYLSPGLYFYKAEFKKGGIKTGKIFFLN